MRSCKNMIVHVTFSWAKFHYVSGMMELSEPIDKSRWEVTRMGMTMNFVDFAVINIPGEYLDVLPLKINEAVLMAGWRGI